MARPQAQSRNGIIDAAPKSVTLFDYDVPNNEDGLHQEVTPTFGSLRVISMRLLTPLMEKYAASASGNDAVQLGYELSRRAVAEVTNAEGKVFQIAEHDGSSMELWAQMHPKLRTLITQAYADSAVPQAATSSGFLGSRRIRC